MNRLLVGIAVRLHNRRVAAQSALLLVIAASVSLLSLASSQEIYKWVDEQGKVHFSNLPRAGDGKPAEVKPEASGETVVSPEDPMRGFAVRTQAAVNSVEFQLFRKNRELTRARAELERTRDEVADAERDSPLKLPVLRLRERRGTAEVERLEKDVAEIESQVAKLRALQALGEAEGR